MKFKNKYLIGGICLLLILSVVTGCSKSKTITNSEGEEVEVVYENDYVKLVDYKGLEYSDKLLEVTDEDIDNRIEEYRQQNAQYEQIKEGTATEGSTVNIDYVGTIEGDEFPGGTSENANVQIGSNTFIEGFEEGIIGMSVGETKDVEAKFPDNYGDEVLNGKTATFSITLNYICGEKNIIPELNDEYVQSISEVNTVDEYRTFIKDELTTSNKATFESNVRQELINYLVANCEFKEIPKDMIKERKKELKDSYVEYAKMFSMEYEDFVDQMLQTTEEQLEKDIATEAETSVKATLIFNAIAENEKIEVSDTDFDEYLSKQATQYGYTSPEELKASLEQNDEIENSKQQCLNDKVYQLIFDNAIYSASSEEESQLEETPPTDEVAETDEAETTESEATEETVEESTEVEE